MHLKLAAARARGLSFPARALVHTSLSFCAYDLFPRVAENELRFQLKHRYVASLILHASIAEITALLS